MNQIPHSLGTSVERDFPALKQAVITALASSDGTVVFTLDMFAGKSLMLFNCLWYAVSKGASVTFQADKAADSGAKWQEVEVLGER